MMKLREGEHIFKNVLNKFVMTSENNYLIRLGHTGSKNLEANDFDVCLRTVV